MANEGRGPWHHLLLGNGWGRGPQVGVASAAGASPSKLGSSGPGAGLWGSSPASLGRPLWAAAGAPRGAGGSQALAPSQVRQVSPGPRTPSSRRRPGSCGQPRGLPGPAGALPPYRPVSCRESSLGSRARSHRGRAVQGQAGTPAPPLGPGRGRGQRRSPLTLRGRPGAEPHPPRRPWLRPRATPSSPTGTRGGAWTAGCADWTGFRTHAALIGRALPALRRPLEEPRLSPRPETRREAAAEAAAPGAGRGGLL